jgi:peroxiredoxin
MPIRIGEPVPPAFAKAVVLDAGGGSTELRALWADGPCALVFLRHFGCPTCAENVWELLPRLAELRALGVRVALVGSGAPEHLAPFAARVGLEGRAVDLLTDPTLAAYRAAGLARSAWATYRPASLYQMARSIARGHPHAPRRGDPLQQGGTLLVDHRGRIASYHRNASAGGQLPMVELIHAALGVAVRRGDMVL